MKLYGVGRHTGKPLLQHLGGFLRQGMENQGRTDLALVDLRDRAFAIRKLQKGDGVFRSKGTFFLK